MRLPCVKFREPPEKGAGSASPARSRARRITKFDKSILTFGASGGMMGMHIIGMEGWRMDQKKLAIWLKAIAVGCALCGLALFGFILPRFLA